MEKRQYDEMKKVQDEHWWFRGKKYIVVNLFREYCLSKKDDMKILDVGCGMGLVLEEMSKFGVVYGLDFEEEAVNYCRERLNEKLPYVNDTLKVGSLPYDIPFSESFDAIVALDVLEHIENDELAIKKIYDCLEVGGRCLITVPARMDMWSGNDVLNHHYRRYERDELEKKIRNQGFKIIKYSSYNSLLFAPAYIVRKIKNRLKITSSDIPKNFHNGVINKLLTQIFMLEYRRLVGKGFKRGVSLIMIVEK